MYASKKIFLSFAIALGLVQCYYFITSVSGYFINHTFDWLDLLLLPIGVLLIVFGNKADRNRQAAIGTLLFLGLTILFYLIQFLRLSAVRKILANHVFSPGEINALVQGIVALLLFIGVLVFFKVQPITAIEQSWQKKWRILGNVWNSFAIILAAISSSALFMTLGNKKSSANVLSLGWTDGIWNLIACLMLIGCLVLFLRNTYFYAVLAILFAVGFITINNYIWSSQFTHVISQTSDTPLQVWGGELRILGMQLLTGSTALLGSVCYAIGGKKE